MLSLITSKRTFSTTQSTAHFNSMATYNGLLLGAREDGLFLIRGENDNGADINGMLKSGTTDFGLGNNKAFRFFYFGLETNGTCILKVFCNDVMASALTVKPTSPGLLTARVPISHRIRGRYWAWSVENFEGSSLRLHSVDALPVILHRGQG